MSTTAANARSDRTLPTTLDDALSRIRELEDTLEAARQVWRAEGKGDLEDAIRRHRSTGQADGEGQASSSTAATRSASYITRASTVPDVARSSSGPKQPNAPEAVPEAPQDPSAAAPEPVDIGPFVLRALALRKSAQVGSIDDDKVEEEFEVMVDGAGLSEEQKA
ncbi:hypothetical protein JCM10296v2_003025 [Rhodotorula toruloides]